MAKKKIKNTTFDKIPKNFNGNAKVLKLWKKLKIGDIIQFKDYTPAFKLSGPKTQGVSKRVLPPKVNFEITNKTIIRDKYNDTCVITVDTTDFPYSSYRVYLKDVI